MTLITLVPTLNRVKLLENFLKSVRDTETTTSGLILVDHNDFTANKEAYRNMNLPREWTYQYTDAITMGDKIRETKDLWEKYDAINILNDDHEIKTKHWDKKLLKKVDGTNFVTCNDRWMSPRKAAGATVFSKKLLDAVGIPIYPPGMQHLFIDDLWEAIGRSTGCWDIDHSVVIEHHNQLKDPSARDSTFTKVYGSGPDITKHPLWQSDQKAYQDFLQKHLLEVKNKVRVLRGMIPIQYVS